MFFEGHGKVKAQSLASKDVKECLLVEPQCTFDVSVDDALLVEVDQGHQGLTHDDSYEFFFQGGAFHLAWVKAQ